MTAKLFTKPDCPNCEAVKPRLAELGSFVHDEIVIIDATTDEGRKQLEASGAKGEVELPFLEYHSGILFWNVIAALLLLDDCEGGACKIGGDNA